jgi:dihydroorotate dehydrogenase
MPGMHSVRPLIISAPFGNYIQPTGTTATLGTFTAAARGGRVQRIIASVRYYRRIGAWVNKIGLRNPGIDWLVQKVESGKVDAADKLVSIHGFDAADWWTLLDKTAAIKPLAIELNMSCPNVGEVNWPADLFERAVATDVPIIAKLPPVRYRTLFAQAAAAGVRAFHCCNTLPVPAGGLSGKPLMPVALQCIADIRENLAGDLWDDLTIIGGGGVTDPSDIDEYVAAGAGHVAVGTKVMHPKYLWSDRGVRSLIERADKLIGQEQSQGGGS